MSSRITIAEIEDFANFPSGSGLGDMARLLLEAAQRLADSPCPVCQVQNKNPDINPPGSVYTTSGFKDCPNCGGFPLDRWGKAFATKEAAIDSLSNQPKEDGA